MLAGPNSALPPLSNHIFCTQTENCAYNRPRRCEGIEKTYFPSFNKKEDSVTTWRDLPSPLCSKAKQNSLQAKLPKVVLLINTQHIKHPACSCAATPPCRSLPCLGAQTGIRSYFWVYLCVWHFLTLRYFSPSVCTGKFAFSARDSCPRPAGRRLVRSRWTPQNPKQIAQIWEEGTLGSFDDPKWDRTQTMYRWGNTYILFNGLLLILFFNLDITI